MPVRGVSRSGYRHSWRASSGSRTDKVFGKEHSQRQQPGGILKGAPGQAFSGVRGDRLLLQKIVLPMRCPEQAP